MDMKKNRIVRCENVKSRTYGMCRPEELEEQYKQKVLMANRKSAVSGPILPSHLESFLDNNPIVHNHLG